MDARTIRPCPITAFVPALTVPCFSHRNLYRHLFLPPLLRPSSSPSGHAELQDSDSRPHLNLIDRVIVFSCAHHLYRKQYNNVLLYDWTSLPYVRFFDVFTRHCGCNKLHEKGSNSRML